VRGGSFDAYHNEFNLRAFNRSGSPPNGATLYNVGFRVVYIPEPATLGLMAAGWLILLRRRTGLLRTG
jgi:hypothetical protein